jgi:beta-lactamase superfamily II metal-dependent hydrolase
MYAGYPAPFVFDATRRKKKQHLIWGDWIGVKGAPDDGWVPVQVRGAQGWMRQEDIQDERLLELNFIDVGQGDSCFVVTPDDEYLVVDAGEKHNLWWFLRWRFNLRDKPWKQIPIRHAVITHPDRDHYAGFDPLFAAKQLRFDNVWHNGIVERATKPRLGPQMGRGKDAVLTDIVQSQTALSKLLRDDVRVGRARYPTLLRQALKSQRVGHIAAASTKIGHLPGFGPGDRVSLQVLGPAPRRAGRALHLPRLGSDGETKNGHSVVLRLRYGTVTALLGGDLNTPAERYLIAHHTDGAADPVAAARAVFGVDIAKSCHHGSADFLDEFLGYQRPAAWIVSSGDNEPYSHPRPDTLGALGRQGRGGRPLIFSTELARSPAQFKDHPQRFLATMRSKLEEALDETTSEGVSDDEAQGKPLARYQRAIAVYGMVTVRTDGTKALIATKLEKKGVGGRKWDYYCLEPDSDGVLHHVAR